MRFSLSALVLSVALAAADPAPVAPIGSVRLADGAKLSKDWSASIFAKAWADPALQPIRDEFSKGMGKAETELGFNPIDVLMASKGMQLSFVGLQNAAKPQLMFRADLGQYAEKVMAAIKAKKPNLVVKQVPGATEAVADHAGEGTLARFGTVLTFSLNTDSVATPPAGEATADVAINLDVKRLVDAMSAIVPASDKAQFDSVVATMKSQFGVVTYSSDLLPEGIRDRMTNSAPGFGGKAVDRAVLARLPGTTLMTIAIGLDGKAIWKNAGTAMLSQIDLAMHNGTPSGGEATTQEIQGMMGALGIEGGLQQVIEGIDGTAVIALTQGAPIPGATIALPRSRQIDQMIAFALKQVGVDAPADGQSAMLPLPPGVPVALSLLRDKSHWVLSTDAMLLSSWPIGAPGGFADSAMAKTLYAKAPANAWVLGASDTPTVLRTIQGFLGMALAANRGMPAQQKQAINAALTRLAGNAGTGYLFATQDAKGSQVELRGLLGGAFAPAMLAAVAVPTLMQNRISAYETAARSNLKTIYVSEVQFQAGGYQDVDNDNVGEYGLLSELSGRRATNKSKAGDVSFIAGKLANGGTSNGYRFVIYLSDGKGGAVSEPADDSAPRPSMIDGNTVKNADEQEKYFVAYAWPISSDTGRRMFAIAQDGELHEMFWSGTAPQWNDLFGGGTWTDAAAWPMTH